MLARIERRNRLIWEGHPSTLEDAAHAAGGVGLGLLLYRRIHRNARHLGLALVGISAALHLYAILVKPPAHQRLIFGHHHGGQK